MICVYHSRDLDGWCSAAIIKKKFPNVELIGWDYNDPIPDIPDNQEVILVDISFPLEELTALYNRSKHVTWIDHHKTAIDEFDDKSILENFSGFTPVLQIGKAACELTWEHYFSNEKMPWAVELLGAYDVWRQDDEANDWEGEVMPFQYGMRTICKSPESFDQSLLLPNAIDSINKIMVSGDTILTYQDTINEKACELYAFEMEFEGLNAICLNNTYFNSKTFESVYDPERHDIMLAFCFTGSKWKHSIYTTHDHIDVSELAKRRGGGGHQKAAGFVTDYNLVDLTEQE